MPCQMVYELFRGARTRAKEHGQPFGLTIEDVRHAIPQDMLCPALGISLTMGERNMHNASPTLDRVNNAWGYTPDNIAVISFAANSAKRDLTAAQLERIAAWMRSKGLN